MSMERWSEEDKKTLKENLGKITPAAIAELIGKSEQAVRLYCYRHRIPLARTLEHPMLVELLRVKFGDPEYFQPTRTFFEKVGISQKRFSKLRQGYAQPTEAELQRLSAEWNLTTPEAIKFFSSRQLNLFG